MDSDNNQVKESKKPKSTSESFLSEEAFFRAKHRAKEAAIAAREKLKELERNQKKSLDNWNKIHVFNIMVNLLFDGVITSETFNEYCDKTLKEDYQKDNVKSSINTALKKKKEAANKDTEQLAVQDNPRQL